MTDPQPAASTPSDLRAAALNDRSGIDEKRLVLGGRTYVIAAPTIAEAEEIQSKSVKVNQGKGGKVDVSVDSAKRKAMAIIRLVRSETGGRVFEESDVEVLLSAKRGSIADKLGAAALEQLAVDEEEIEGN